MKLKLAMIPVIVSFSTVSLSPCFAQGPQNWATNEANKIQQDAASGAINQNQATRLETRDAQIQAQEQQDMNQNGGKLTQQERGQIGSELRNLNQHTGQDIQRDNPNFNNNNGLPQTWQNRNGVNPSTGNPFNMQNRGASGQFGNGNPYRHHRHQFNQQTQGNSINPQQQQFWQR